MQYTDERHHLAVEFTSKGCEIPRDELARMETTLEPLREAVWRFPSADLRITAIHHAGLDAYHVEARLKLPGRTVFTAEWDPYLDTAFQRMVRKLVHKVEAYSDSPDRRAVELAEHHEALERDIVAPEDPDAGPLAEAVQAGDYRAFRIALATYEEWLRKRVGRWVQRYAEAQARFGDELLLGDLVEEVYLNAFERFTERTTAIRLSEWLDNLIDPSLKALLRHPEEEAENASLARTLRDTNG